MIKVASHGVQLLWVQAREVEYEVNSRPIGHRGSTIPEWKTTTTPPHYAGVTTQTIPHLMKRHRIFTVVRNDGTGGTQALGTEKMYDDCGNYT